MTKALLWIFLQFKVVLSSFLFKSHSSLHTDIFFDLSHKIKVSKVMKQAVY